MRNEQKTQRSTRSGDLVMQQSLALRSFLGARAKRRAAQKRASQARTQVTWTDGKPGTH